MFVPHECTVTRWAHGTACVYIHIYICIYTYPPNFGDQPESRVFFLWDLVSDYKSAAVVDVVSIFNYTCIQRNKTTWWWHVIHTVWSEWVQQFYFIVPAVWVCVSAVLDSLQPFFLTCPFLLSTPYPSIWSFLFLLSIKCGCYWDFSHEIALSKTQFVLKTQPKWTSL